MSDRDRSLVPGASFHREGPDVVFTCVNDANSILGPRRATDADRANHPQAWAAFQATEAQPEPQDVPADPDPVLVRPAGHKPPKRRRKQ